jgi:DNA-binding response OmpR family regulator
MESAQPGSSPDGTGARRVALLLDNDLFFSVKIADTLNHAGFQTRNVRTVGAFATALADSQPSVALLNTGARGLDWQAAIRAARDAGLPVVAFGSHVDTETQQRARALGATSVIANSKLAGDLAAVVERAIRRAARTEAAPAATEPADDAER